MAYIEGRVVHDADAHIMEWPTWLADYADPEWRDRMTREATDGDGSPLDIERVRAKHESDDYRATEDAEIMSRKNFAATGSFIRDDRPRALDLLGVASQLVFNTFHNGRFAAWEQTQPELVYHAARAHNRGMIDFCSVDRRLLPTLYVPLADFDASAAMAREAIEMGAAALLVPSACPEGTLAEPPRARPGVGRRPGRRDPGRVPRRRRGRPLQPRLLPERPADPGRLPRR